MQAILLDGIIPDEIQNKLPIIAILFTKHKVKNAYVFGLTNY